MNKLDYLPRSVLVAMFGALLVTGCASKNMAPLEDRSRPVGGAAAAASRSATAAPAAPVSGTAVQAAATEPVVRTARPGYYIVKEGDTLYRIALDNGQDYRDVALWNRLDNPNLIKVGQELRVTVPEESAQLVAVTRPIGVVTAVEKKPLDGNTDILKREPKAGREAYSDEAYAKYSKPAEGMTRVEIAAPVVTPVKPDVKPEAKPEVAVAKPDDEVKWAWPANGKLVGQFVEGGNKGLDIAGKAGDPVVAASEGKVVYAGSGLRGYGQLVIVKHNATFLTAYAHNSKLLVKEGQAVTQGQKIAEMGNTDADQVKLHFEVRRQGKPVDPLKHLPAR